MVLGIIAAFLVGAIVGAAALAAVALISSKEWDDNEMAGRSGVEDE